MAIHLQLIDIIKNLSKLISKLSSFYDSPNQIKEEK